MKRRHFIYNSGIAFASTMIPFSSIVNKNTTENNDTKQYLQSLLKKWCDGLIIHQIEAPNDKSRHGALWCEACQTIHGRCFEAVYPLLYMFQLSGDKKYLESGIRVFEWEKNVSQNDGSWTVMPDPKTWRGISVFGAIALAETLHFHGHLLPPDIKINWTERLSRVAEYILKNFDLTFTNINYGFTAIYALHLMSEVLQKHTFQNRSEALAADIKNWFTEPHKLVFGEGKPSTKISKKGLKAVDLGYNVEETLNGVALYAIEKNDKKLLELLKKSFEGHLEFMLPDGAWDNSWGTRQYKWSYWGSRTTDGCQVGFTALAHLNPIFGKAALKNTQLLEECTDSGLIHGGLHYVSHGVKPCIHHTFCHAKTLATVLNRDSNLEHWTEKKALPRESHYGVKEFSEIDVLLINKGSWSATVSAYDFEYTDKSQQATGGSLAVLFHKKIGAIFTASMAKYRKVEPFNQQINDEKDFALTPRIETFQNNSWFTNLFDLEAKVTHKTEKDKISIIATVRLVDEEKQSPNDKETHFQLQYLFTKSEITVSAKKISKTDLSVSLNLPIISKSNEVVKQVSPQKIEIFKKNGKLILESNVPLLIQETQKKRAFNLVPGMEVLPIVASISASNMEEIWCKIRVIQV